jgi:hypothetical protein
MATSRQERNAELARRGLEVYNRGDIDAVMELFSEAWESFDIRVDEVEPVGERFVVVHAHQVGRGRGSGVSVEQDVVYLYEIDDERCVYLAIYPDRERALADIRRRGADKLLRP